MLTKLKSCSKCHLALPISEFSKNKSKVDGLSGHCKKCKAEYQNSWYVKNKEAHIERVRKRNKRILAENREYVIGIKIASGCKDCDESNPVVLDFDHINGDKAFDVGKLSTCSIDTLKKEIAKCEIVCSNCHRKRTARRNPSHWAYQSEYV